MTILCYHSVQPDWGSPLAMHPTTFEEHCDWLSKHRRVVPLAEAVDRLGHFGQLPRGIACLTFDDGFTGVRDYALPILTRYRLPATVFLVAKTLTEAGHPVDWVDTPAGYELTTLTVEQVLEMQSAGVSFQSHSDAHLDLTSLTFDDCVRDLRQSRELLESLLGRDVPLLAYPRGRHHEGVRAAAAAAGYTHAFTLPERRERAGPYAVPRVGLYRGNSVRNLQIKSSYPYLALRTSSAFRLGQRLNRAARRSRGGAP